MIVANRSADDESMLHLVLEIAKALVDQSDAVDVELVEENGSATLNLRVAQSDVGKVIGKQGRTARSIRALLSAAGMKLHKRYDLNIEEKQHQAAAEHSSMPDKENDACDRSRVAKSSFRLQMRTHRIA
jgi:uncharacterized protein